MKLGSSSFFGIDVGGTTTRVGLVSPGGRIISSDRFETPRSSESFVDHLAARIAFLRNADTVVDGLGLALPGPVDAEKGVLIRSVNLSFLEGFPLVEHLARRTSGRIVLTTDAEAATWGEYSVTDPRPARFVHLRLGTGIACGTVVDGVPSPIDSQRRTHRPELVVDKRPEAAACACGLRGCLELFASGPAIGSLARRMGLDRELTALHSDFSNGRAEACMLVSSVAGWLVQGIQNILDSLPAPSQRPAKESDATVVLGGGVLTALPALYENVTLRWRRQSETDCSRAGLQPARLGDNAGVIGAALIAASTARDSS